MQRVRIRKERPQQDPPWYGEPLEWPLDPRDPAIAKAKQLQRKRDG